MKAFIKIPVWDGEEEVDLYVRTSQIEAVFWIEEDKLTCIGLIACRQALHTKLSIDRVLALMGELNT
jgi:hypothetical protein